MSFPNLSLFLKYGDDLLERISDTGSKTAFRFITFGYDSSIKSEVLRIKYRFNYEDDQSVTLMVCLTYDKKKRELKLSIVPDMISRDADKYVGEYSELWHHDMFGTFFRGITDTLNEQVEKYRTKFMDYLTQLKNLDTEFIIDSVEYVAKLKDKYPEFEIKTERETDGIGYVVTIENQDDDQVVFATSPFRIEDYDGFFRDFIQNANLDFNCFVGSPKDFFAAVETIVDGALEYKKLLNSTYEKYTKIVQTRDDD
jgi:hypothetical protein